MQYREHRGTLAVSMATLQIFETKQELINHINSLYFPFGRKVVELKFIHVGFDTRTSWNTYNVAVRFSNEKQFFIVGMSDSIFTDN